MNCGTDSFGRSLNVIVFVIADTPKWRAVYADSTGLFDLARAAVERHARAVPDDHVIEQADVDEREGVVDALGDQLVGLARLRDTGRVIVRNDHGGRVPPQRLLDDPAREYVRAVDRAAKQFLELNHAMAIVEVETASTVYWIAI